MAYLLIISMTVKRGFIEEVVTLLKEIVDKMQDADGCLSIQLVEDVIHPGKFKLYEKWESLDKQKEFLAYLQSEGLVSKLKELLKEGPLSESYSTNS